MKRTLTAGLVAAALTVGVGIGAYAGGARTVSAFGRSLDGKARIIDGDTLAIGSQHIRLQGLDAPELGDAGGAASRDALIAFTQGLPLHCVPDGTRSYERVVAICFLPDGTDVAARMVADGFALDCAHFSHGRYAAIEDERTRQEQHRAPYCRTPRRNPLPSQ